MPSRLTVRCLRPSGSGSLGVDGEYVIWVELGAPVSAVKERLASIVGHHQSQLRLVCAGKVWMDHVTLASYGAVDGGLVFCLLPAVSSSSFAATSGLTVASLPGPQRPQAHGFPCISFAPTSVSRASGLTTHASQVRVPTAGHVAHPNTSATPQPVYNSYLLEAFTRGYNQGRSSALVPTNVLGFQTRAETSSIPSRANPLLVASPSSTAGAQFARGPVGIGRPGAANGNSAHGARISPEGASTGQTQVSGVPLDVGRRAAASVSSPCDVQQRATNVSIEHTSAAHHAAIANRVQQALRSPDAIRTLVQANPRLTQLMEENPELEQMINDPDTGQLMAQLVNPSLRREFTRQADVARSHLNVAPGGFEAMRRAHEQLAPLACPACEDSSTQVDATVSMPSCSVGDAGPNCAALPNPWANSSPTRVTSSSGVLSMNEKPSTSLLDSAAASGFDGGDGQESAVNPVAALLQERDQMASMLGKMKQMLQETESRNNAMAEMIQMRLATAETQSARESEQAQDPALAVPAEAAMGAQMVAGEAQLMAQPEDVESVSGDGAGRIHCNPPE